MQDILNKVKEWAKGITWENSRRYVAVVALFVVLVVILAKCTGPNTSKKDSTETTEATEATEAGVASSFEFDTEFAVDSDEAMIGLLQNYYQAFVNADTATLETIAYPMTENEKNYIGVLAEYYEEIQDISYYSKKGITEGSYFVSVCNNIKFKGIDTVAPALDFFYVQTDEAGKLYIDNAYSYFNQNFKESPVDNDIVAIMDKYMEQDDFISIQTEIDTNYEKAVASDEKLETMISTTLAASIRDWLSTATIVPASEVTEENTESTTEETTEKKDEKKEETTEKKEEKTETTQVKTKDVVNVRASASTDAKILGKLTEGVVLKKLGEDGDWTIVSYSGGKDGKGYIKTENLKDVK